MFLENVQNSQENTFVRICFLMKLEACNVIIKETLGQVFSCEFCEISENTFFYRTPPDGCFCLIFTNHNFISLACRFKSFSNVHILLSSKLGHRLKIFLYDVDKFTKNVNTNVYQWV